MTRLAREQGAGAGYHYPHDHPEGIDPDHVTCLPAPLAGMRGQIGVTGTLGWEAEATAQLEARRARVGVGREQPGDDEEP